ncbi:MAG TPA: metallophosphoesterase [Luteolibacter sp.]|nr:metallophosphoesterase [Luteolibacter sp.]
MPSSRRDFLMTTTVAATAALLPARWAAAEEIPKGAKPKLRFAVASDLHHGQNNTPFDQMSGDLVRWINEEKRGKGLDALFLNGDLSNNSTAALLALRDGHLSKLQVPYYAIKGNHDFVDGQPGSPTESWEKIWGYPSNRTVKIGDFVFVMADTTAPAKANVYLAADIGWLKAQFEAHRKAPAIFAMIHIQQRAHKVDGWPQHGVSDKEEMPKAEAVMDLLEATPNVRAVFHGHNHLETSVYVSGERRYFFDSHVGGNWGAKKGYRIVEIYEDHRMLTYQINAEDRLELNRHELPR